MTTLFCIVGEHGVGKSIVGDALEAAYSNNGRTTVYHMHEGQVGAPTAQDLQLMRDVGVLSECGKKRQPVDILIVEYTELPDGVSFHRADMIIRIERAA